MLRVATVFFHSIAYTGKPVTLRMKKALPLCGKAFSFVGVAGFEPATLWSQTRCANRAALHPALCSVALAKVIISAN